MSLGIRLELASVATRRPLKRIPLRQTGKRNAGMAGALAPAP